MGNESEDMSHKIGQLNGKWAMLFKIALASHPFVIALMVWIVGETFANKAFRESDERFTKSDGLVLRAELVERMASLPSQEWKDRIADIDKRSQETLTRLVRIEAVLTK